LDTIGTLRRILFVDIKNLLTLEEVLYYGSLGEVTITGHEDWDYIRQLILTNSESRYEAGMEYVRATM
jgi:hypothetical protein